MTAVDVPSRQAEVVADVAEEVAEALKSSGSANGPIAFKGTAVLLYVPWAAKRLFDHLIGEQDNITLFLHALVSDVVVDGDRLEAVVIASKRGPQAVRAKAFVDATGDADLVVHAGAPWTIGDPGQRQFASMQFVMQHVDLTAALAAGRAGARVCLLERYGFLGGNFTVASVGTICGLYVSEAGSWAYVTRGIAEEVAEALKATGSANGPIPFKGTAVLLYVPWAAKRLFDHLVGEHEHVTLFLHALVSDVVRDGDRVEAVVVATKRGPQAVRARAFVDATGDADLVVHAGAPWT
ncbi:MAG: FAD-dependent oxidoreductase, partial [Acidimicrobiia bacterium]|nr:FAD-dependent oxidoreductase [Acidimicrobiia bacterium]